MADSTTPAAGVTVTALDPGGITVARTLSAADGTYLLRLTRDGRFELQVLRIGFRPTRLQLPPVAASELRSVDIILVARPIELPAVSVTDRDNCDLHGSEADVFLRVWQQARDALGATALSESPAQGEALEVHVLHVEGTEDRSGVIIRGRDLVAKNRHPEIDSAKARETYGGRLFAMTSSETLLVRGYVRPRPDGTVLFDAPSTDALRADGFLARHCFGVESPPSDHPDWIGISFKPISDVDSAADIAGTLWLSRATAELRRLDFVYTNLQYLPHAMCNTDGKSCYRSENSDGTGGSLTYAYLPSGELFVSRWTIRTPPEEYQRRYSGVKLRMVNRNFEVCYSGKNCDPLIVPFARLGVSSGAIASIARDGTEIFRDDTTISALLRIAAKQAAKTPAHITGVVTDVNGRPLRGAVVSTDNPARAAITNDSGRFEIHSLPAKAIGITIKKSGYESVAFRLPLTANVTRRLELTLVAAPLEKPR